MLNQNQDLKGILKATVCPNCPAGPFYKVNILNLHTLVSCLNLTQSWGGKTGFTECIDKRCCGTASVGQTICRLAVRPSHLGSLSTCDNTLCESWMKNANLYTREWVYEC